MPAFAGMTTTVRWFNSPWQCWLEPSQAGFPQHPVQAVEIEPLRVRIAGVAEAVGHARGAVLGERAPLPPVELGLDDVAVRKLDGRARIVLGHHHLVQLLAGTDAHDLVR